MLFLIQSTLRESICAESLSVVNLLIEEVFNRKKRAAGGDHFYDTDTDSESDDFLFSQQFIELLMKLTSKTSEIIKKVEVSNSNLAFQLPSFICNITNFKHSQVETVTELSLIRCCNKVILFAASIRFWKR
jgi:hypothetical protein